MNKQELVDAVAAKTGGSKAATGEAIDAVIAAITAEVTKGGTVQLVGFGSFATGARCAGRPQSGDRCRDPDPGCEDGEVHGGEGVQGRSERRLRPDAGRRPDFCRWRGGQQASR
ncbi:hypothetical protein R69658_05222 [Paraburkholderia aspalathi]|uniref:DNA-binding protein HU-beta n=1 Tax=Paraburkholderia aspalathi TaxID=1324617 RepID=A0ABN7MHN1_9BURK|nr:hypothetical protein R69658_05222 [Paraburkholderia aspalathi]